MWTGVMAAMLSSRILGRTERAVPPVLWELDVARADGGSFADVLAIVAAAGADWFFIPHSVLTADIPLLADQLRALNRANVVVGVAGDQLVSRTQRAEVERIDALGKLRCAAVMVQVASPSELKSGGPFHRLNALRQQGRCDFLFAEAQTVADAEWMVDSSPAHAVSLPFGIGDQTAAYRVMKSAEELGTALLARRPEAAVWNVAAPSPIEDLSFIVSHATATMVIEPLPIDRDEARDVLAALAKPMAEDARLDYWQRFSAAVREPAKPRGNHPPEYGA
jgi:hypothetical protein